MKKYFRIVSDSLRASFSHPTFWILGALAAFNINAGIVELTIQNTLHLIKRGSLVANLTAELTKGNFFDDYVRFITLGNFTLSKGLVWTILVLSFILVILYITTSAQIGLIKNSYAVARKKKITKLTLHDTNPHVVDVLALNVASRAVLGIILGVTALPFVLALYSQDALLSAVAGVLFVIFFIVLGASLSLVTSFAVIDAVTHGRDFLSAIRHGWRTFVRNILVSFEIIISLLLIRLGVYIIAFIVLGVIVIPLGMLTLSFLMANSIGAFGVSLALMSIFLLVAFIILTGWYVSLYTITLTSLYHKLSKPTLLQKLPAFFERINNYLIPTAHDITRSISKVATSPEVEAYITKTTDRAVGKGKKTYQAYKPVLIGIKKDLEETIAQEKKKLKNVPQKIAKQSAEDLKKGTRTVATKLKKTSPTVARIAKRYEAATKTLKSPTTSAKKNKASVKKKTKKSS